MNMFQINLMQHLIGMMSSGLFGKCFILSHIEVLKLIVNRFSCVERNVLIINTLIQCRFTKLPVILKGIITQEDARLALQTGCKGIIVSNHGARQLDTVPATIEALPEIVRAVGSQMTVMIDGGIRTGTDVFKALAIGAKCVFVGRPILFGLAVNGQNGVENVLNILRDEFDGAMALAGVNKVSEINEKFIAHENTFCLSKL